MSIPNCQPTRALREFGTGSRHPPRRRAMVSSFSPELTNPPGGGPLFGRRSCRTGPLYVSNLSVLTTKAWQVGESNAFLPN